MTAQTLEQTVVELEALHGAFNDVLTQAKAQLENLQMSDSDMRELGSRLVTERDFRSSIITGLYYELNQNLGNIVDDPDAMNSWAASQSFRRIADRILDHVKDEIAEFVMATITEVMQSQKIEQAIEAKFLEHDAVKSALVIQHAVAKLLPDTE